MANAGVTQTAALGNGSLDQVAQIELGILFAEAVALVDSGATHRCYLRIRLLEDRPAVAVEIAGIHSRTSLTIRFER